jgi:hypothetical protein
MLLQVMPFPGDIGGYFHAVAQTDPGYLSQSGIRLLGRNSKNLKTNTALKRGLRTDRPIFQMVKDESQSWPLALFPDSLSLLFD